MVQDVPVDKMILRITQVFKDKAQDQYSRWKHKSWFTEKSSFVIAINSADLEYPQDYLEIPLVIKALFGLEFLQISREGQKGFSWREKIQKNESNVPVNYFSKPDFNFVSGVLFSDKYVLDHQEKIGDDCVFVNNPFANNPVSENIVKFFKNWSAKQNNRICLTKNY